MSEEWNDLAQSEKDGPSVLTQIILLIAVSAMVMIFFLGM
tara:strand:+ start:289 stop:408 length:120 start_codon:yes stop_codon:yes gene_type:complete